MNSRRPVASVLVAFAACIVAGCDGNTSSVDATVTDADVVLPASCSGCPNDCCLLPDGGAACMSWDRRNPVTLQCSCGGGPACPSPGACCPPFTDPQPQLPDMCLASSAQCDDRPTP